MPIEAACSCGKRFAAKEDLAGKTVTCPACGSPFVVPVQLVKNVATYAVTAAPTGASLSPLYATLHLFPNGVIPAPTTSERRTASVAPVWIAFGIAASSAVGMMALSIMSFFWVADHFKPLMSRKLASSQVNYNFTPPNYSPPPSYSIPSYQAPQFTMPQELTRPMTSFPSGEYPRIGAMPSVDAGFSTASTPPPSMPSEWMPTVPTPSAAPVAPPSSTPFTPPPTSPGPGSAASDTTNPARRMEIYREAKRELSNRTSAIDRSLQGRPGRPASPVLAQTLQRHRQVILNSTESMLSRRFGISQQELQSIIQEGDRSNWPSN